MSAPQANPQESQKIHHAWNRASLALLVAFIIIISWIAYLTIVEPNKNSEAFTEFYIKDASNILEDNNLTVNVDQPISLSVAVVNHEGTRSAYQIQIEFGDNVYTSSVYNIDDNKSAEIPILFSMPTSGKDQRINFFLDRKGSPFPYRELHLYIDVELMKMYIPMIGR